MFDFKAKNIIKLQSILAYLLIFFDIYSGFSNDDSDSEGIYDFTKTTIDKPVYVYQHHFAEDAPVVLGQVKHHVFLYDLKDPFRLEYRAFCSGSIISENRVLTSANCLLTNRKRKKHIFEKVKVVAGILTTSLKLNETDKVAQVRTISNLYSQYSYRFPSFNLAILVVNKNWIFNEFVKRILVATIDQDFNGTCMIANAKATQSWFENKYLVTNQVVLLSTQKCEDIYSTSRKFQYCCFFEYIKYVSMEAEGSGMICRGTNDIAETETEGLLVGVASLISSELPSLFHRVGLFHKWITDRTAILKTDCFTINIVKHVIKHVKVIAGVLATSVKVELMEQTRQHRSIHHMYSQYLYRYPFRNLLILIVNRRFKFNIFVNRITIASADLDFDGTCHVASARVTQTGKRLKNLVINEIAVIPSVECEEQILIYTHLFYCTTFSHHKITVTPESEGAGMICRGTGDPAETEPEGLLVGVSGIPTLKMPTLYNRVGLFEKWIKDKGNRISQSLIMILLCLLFIFMGIK